MSSIGEYLFGVICAAVLCAVVTQLVGKDGFLAVGIKLITGVYMLLSLVSPVMSLNISSPGEIFSDISLEAEEITSAAAAETNQSIRAIITEQTQAYILDKAKTYNADITVEVTTSDEEIPRPISVKISGDVSPYTKKLLMNSIADELGIPAEAQTWN